MPSLLASTTTCGTARHSLTPSSSVPHPPLSPFPLSSPFLSLLCHSLRPWSVSVVCLYSFSHEASSLSHASQTRFSSSSSTNSPIQATLHKSQNAFTASLRIPMSGRTTFSPTMGRLRPCIMLWVGGSLSLNGYLMHVTCPFSLVHLCV